MQHVSTVNISFPKSLLKAIDSVAERESRTRSELLREASRMYIERKERWTKISAFWRKEAKGLRLKPADIENALREVRLKK